MSKPLMIFDGDCGFCRRWIERWRMITGGQVDYEPYQKVATQFPEIPEGNFKKSVQLVEDSPSGRRVTSGAEAVYRSLSYNSRRRWLLWLYEKFPLFKSVSESFYSLVARNRVFFSKLTRLFWGDHVEPSTYRFSTFFFLRILAVIYAIAFLSLAGQVLGLIGSQGILPIGMLMDQLRERFQDRSFWILPTLVWAQSSDGFLLFLCYGGFLLSVLAFLGLVPNLMLFLLWGFYLSLVNAGQEFLSFQWDNLLLETGFISIFLAPLTLWDRFSRNFEPPAAPRFLLKWLLFRLSFLSGVVKLLSGDMTWRSLSALQFHYETQPLPPWTAWYMHHLPAAFHQFSVIGMFVIELIIPFLFFMPRRLRHAACFAALFLQALIFIAGNYCFFNLLAMALCLLLLDDDFWGYARIVVMDPLKIRLGRKMPRFVTLPVVLIVLWVSIAQMGGMWREKRRGMPPDMISKVAAPFRSVNSYGLFAVMTTERDEIIVEGSNDGINWSAYEFKYKPGDLSQKPGFVQPHQPRLDWQMWFAALGSYRQNPWFLNFCIRLLQGSPEVLKLMKKNPFPEAPPQYMRAVLYHYRFSDARERKDYGVWWMKEEKGIYCPPLSLKNQEG